MASIHFDVWPADDVNGMALGELTQAKSKTFRRVDQAIGAGQFVINRHDSQYIDGWCAQDNLVRVRLVDGGPFDYDDSRYVFAFFIESGDDVVLTKNEKGGEEFTRGGRDAVVILRRAVVNYEADIEESQEPYWHSALKDGHVHFLQRNPGEVLRIMLRNAGARTPNPLEPSSHDFSGDGNSTPGRDSAGNLWDDSDADWHIPVGMDHLELLGMLASGDMFWRMGEDLVLHAYDDDPGRDLSGSITFAHAVDIATSAERTIEAREAISRALVQGSLKDGGFTFRWVASAPTESFLGGRREGFVEYEATPTAARLDKAGARAIRRRRLKFEGPTTLGVLDTPGQTAFTDYLPGDSVTVDVPDIFDSVAVKVYAITLTERPAGDYDIEIELQEVPFDPVQGDLPNTAECGSCPPLTPHVPGTQTGEDPPVADDTLTVCNWVEGGGGPGGPRQGLGTTSFTVVPGEVVTFRVTQTQHEPFAFTEQIYIGNSANAFQYYARCPTTCPDGGAYAPGSITDSGYFTIPTSGDGAAAGTIDFLAETDGYVGGSGYINDCWTLELWHGAVDLDGSPDVTIPPSTGQQVTHETPAISIGGSTTTLTLDWPYATGSLRIRVDGVLISSASFVETTPGSGIVTLSWAIDADETVTVDYQAAT